MKIWSFFSIVPLGRDARPAGSLKILKVNSARRGGFTLIELLTVLAIISILGCLLLPAMAKTRVGSTGADCLTNKRQMMIAWDMYAADNNDVMVPNAPSLEGAGWVPGTSENWGNASINTNVAQLQQAPLGFYLSGQINAYRCPADVLPSANGIRLRSVSMVGSMGGVGLVGSSASYNAPGVVFDKISDLTRLGPAGAIVFVDESMCTLNDGYLQIDTQGSDGYFPDIPANYHDGAGSFGYADGHAEIHKWQTTPLLTVPYGPSFGYGSFTFSGASKTNADWLWWCQHVDYNP